MTKNAVAGSLVIVPSLDKGAGLVYRVQVLNNENETEYYPKQLFVDLEKSIMYYLTANSCVTW